MHFLVEPVCSYLDMCSQGIFVHLAHGDIVLFVHYFSIVLGFQALDRLGSAKKKRSELGKFSDTKDLTHSWKFFN